MKSVFAIPLHKKQNISCNKYRDKTSKHHTSHILHTFGRLIHFPTETGHFIPEDEDVQCLWARLLLSKDCTRSIFLYISFLFDRDVDHF